MICVMAICIYLVYPGMGRTCTRLVIKQQKEMTSCAYVMRSNVNGEDSFAI